ncbi:hypothetical protein SAMN05661091_3751 [Paenibacillus uliginis N3/975]|uniref:Uncharacterized protein n=1 Tax=Paenibacillus uliginis N3/975 TaxID=1313296 RepID=A0A1X7HKU5_9BACL|nr:hypothetical protein [Paenibacillus uliginis]SMF87482.1 hypothetical protein SAMN05661091_3751 [Paenibacillus uliginis N3/975]
MTGPDDKNFSTGEELFNYANYLGQLVLKSLPLLGIMVLIVQLLLHIDSVRPFLSSVYRMEGVPVDTQNVKDWMDEKKPSFLHHSS